MFFPWKQALHGKMVDMKFDSDIIKEVLPMFDFLTVVEKGHIQKGAEHKRVCKQMWSTQKSGQNSVWQVSRWVFHSVLATAKDEGNVQL